jgi:predicted acylesterase/phospholipase RssA
MPRNMAMVLGGGGARGAFHAGALAELFLNRVSDGGRSFPRVDFRRIAVVSGTSTGALCAAMLVQFLARNAGRAPGDALDTRDLDTLLTIYRNTGTAGIMTPRIDPAWQNVINGVAGLLGAGSLPADKVVALVVGVSIYDQEPLRRLIRQHVDLAVQKQAADAGIELVINTYNLTALRAETFTNKDADRALLHDAIIASAAIPAVMTPHTFKRGGVEAVYVDGALGAPVPYKAAVRTGVSRILAISLNYFGARKGKGQYKVGLEVLKDAAYTLDQEVSDGCELMAKYNETLGIIRENCALGGIDFATVIKGADATVLTQNPSGAVRREFTLHIPLGTLVIEDIDFDPTKMQTLSVAGSDAVKGQWANIAASLQVPLHA